MTRLRADVEADHDTYHSYLEARRDLLIETDPAVVDTGDATTEHRFSQASGPFAAYERRVVWTPPAAHGGTGRVLQETTYELDIPLWGPLFSIPARRHLTGPPTVSPWWAPPEPVDRIAMIVLAVIALVAVVGGYLGTLLAQTITFAVEEFDASGTQQGDLLAATRLGAFLALAVVTMADRRGRRLAVLLAGFGGVTATVLGAAAPTLFWLGASQTVARGLATSLLVLLPIIAAEEMPAGSRAYALSLLALASGLGAGGAAVWALPLADISERSWRLIYLIPIAFYLPMIWVARRLPETRRFVEHAPLTDEAAGRIKAPPINRRRLALLAASKFLNSLFVSPASQFQNDYLRTERGFSASRISLLTLITQTPASAGVGVGGRLADTRGRRRVGATAVVLGTVSGVVAFQISGIGLWFASFFAAILGAAAIPALGVYSPEMFPTQNRGRANSIITFAAQSGAVVGLSITGRLADRWGSIGWPLLLLAAGPLLYAVLVRRYYPETVNTELEDLNPEDASTPQRSAR